MYKIRGLLVKNTIILIYDLQIIESLQLIGFSNFKESKILRIYEYVDFRFFENYDLKTDKYIYIIYSEM